MAYLAPPECPKRPRKSRERETVHIHIYTHTHNYMYIYIYDIPSADRVRSATEEIRVLPSPALPVGSAA